AQQALRFNNYLLLDQLFRVDGLAIGVQLKEVQALGPALRRLYGEGGLPLGQRRLPLVQGAARAVYYHYAPGLGSGGIYSQLEGAGHSGIGQQATTPSRRSLLSLG
ncbi:hypothetical protein RZS08_05320, partial [Arthrospira platensis SPKY1]|nr:hypothetical protein [Arthrospira platensis SPKY1]